MKRRDLLAHLRAHDYELLLEGDNHSWWRHKITNKRSAVPRHNDISDILAVKICRDVGVQVP